MNSSTLPRLAPWLMEMRALGRLAVPLAATQLAQMAVITTDLVLIGRLGKHRSPRPHWVRRSGYSAGWWAMGQPPPWPRSWRRFWERAPGTEPVARQRAHGSLGSGIAGTAAGTVLCLAEPILRLTGQTRPWRRSPRHTHRRWPLACRTFGFMVLRSFALALSRPRAPMYIMVAMIVVNLIGNYVLIFGHFGAPPLA